MVRMHPGLAALAADNNFQALVGCFHGHAHCRRCQLRILAAYVKGLGLEDLEGCEHFFSKSNALALTTRYASAFHRQQAITTYLRHADSADAYQGLSE
jgi:ornithine cyclodeaminase/alanine dehydrogenase-like protein (mu-crystallin family)